MTTSLGSVFREALDPVAFARGRGFIAEPWQSKLLRSTARRIVVPCSRQVGKSTTTGYKSLHVALSNPGRDVLIVSPAQRQSSEMLETIKTIYRGMRAAPRLVKDNDSEMVLHNRARILSLPGVEGTIRGFANVKLLVIDEASRVLDGVFAAVLPMVGSDGQIMALSTPWGQRGWFYEVAEEAPLNGWEKHRVTVFDSAQWTPQRIAEVRASVGKFAFASDYEALFQDTDNQLFSSEDVRRAFTSEVQPLFPNGVFE